MRLYAHTDIVQNPDLANHAQYARFMGGILVFYPPTFGNDSHWVEIKGAAVRKHAKKLTAQD